jgi:hypothetical protein
MKTIGLLAVGLILGAVVMQTMVQGYTPSNSPAANRDSAPASQPATRTFTGTFNWNGAGNKTFPLKAVLTATEANTFSAIYTFSWQNRPTTFTGVVKVNPDTKEVSGTAKMAGGRTFAFSGKEANGVINFTHRETTGGGNAATGSGMLK